MGRLTTYDHFQMRQLAARLRAARIAAGCVSMDDGARRCGTVSGVYNRHETGVIMPTIPLILRYAKGFGVSPCWLAFGIAVKKAKPPPRRSTRFST